MYVIQANLTNSSGGAVAVLGHSIAANSTEAVILPADKCTWQVADNAAGGYQISDVKFHDGVSASVDPAASGSIAGAYNFGYIGKSGRFVEMT